MEPKCKKCGRPLRDPLSIIRGMGPACAGIASKGRGYGSIRSARHAPSPATGNENGEGTSVSPVPGENQRRVPEALEAFPPDLVDLVLAAPAPGAIAACIRDYSRQRKKKLQPFRLLKQIRRTCIEHRLPFWPGLSIRNQPLPCIPWGEQDWKIGDHGRVINTNELLAYLSRYGIITQDLTETRM